MSPQELSIKELRSLSKRVLMWRVKHGMKHREILEILKNRYGWNPAECEEVFMRMDGVEGREA